MKKLLTLLIAITIWSCAKNKEVVDTVIVNANVYTVNNTFDKAEAFAVKDGKFVAIGTSKAITDKFDAENILDVSGKTIVPGFIDAHCHFYGLGLEQNRVNLAETSSFDEVMKRVLDFQNTKQTNFIIGLGWDQNDWEEKAFPNNKLLNALFPNTPVALTRIDGHAMLCNQAALDLAGITKQTKIEGGEVVIENNELTGILIDNPMAMVEAVYPNPTKQEQINALLQAQDICFDLGLTTVSDAGLDKSVIQLIDSLQQTGGLNMRVYAMVSNTQKNLDYYLNNGPIKTDKLNVQSVKVYADGALGSRGAALKKTYSDKHNHFGTMVTNPKNIKALAKKIEQANFQMNTHAIGDSANRVVLQAYKAALKDKKDKRWRVEHAQVLTNNDIEFFKDSNIIPSVQPTHATSDMYWVEDRLGADRIKQAYAYKELLKASGKIALGTDFPIEKVSPFLTFYAAVSRQDLEEFPEGGFQKENALTREEALKGMTIWAAYANFEDQEKGSIEKGKFADFVILDKDIMAVEVNKIPTIKVESLFIDGEEQ
ncbi:amidohydrolase [Mangrovimonas spongiae]|uniref:Amidohydrolase n=1 Tax=Mangrovimonas spongiae TaxID=2494697 RepID=A0A3R9MD22_9FLAO|nr:amidohydrolase [Mangrovimonas spongiae]RSK39178.1 amidohydrolase [Mangrovimonas spongiae]